MFSQTFYDLNDIEFLRTLIYASAAAYAGISSVVLRGEIHEFVHKSLAITLQLRGSAVCRRHLREVFVHAGIPATESHYAVIRFEISYVETLAGRANESASAATEARFGKVFPIRRVEQFVEIFVFETGKVEFNERKFFHYLAGIFLLSFNFFVVRFLSERFYDTLQCLAFFGIERKIQVIADDVAGNVPRGFGRDLCRTPCRNNFLRGGNKLIVTIMPASLLAL